MKNGNPLVPSDAQVATYKQRDSRLSLEQARRGAQKELMMQEASNIDTTSDVRKFLMALIDVLA